MYFIIETEKQLQSLPQSEGCFVQLITSNHEYHPNLSRVSLVYYNNFDKGYIISIRHSEAFPLDPQRVFDFIASHKRVWVYDKKFHSYFLNHTNLIDIHLLQLQTQGETRLPETDTLLHKHYYQQYGDREDLNEIIPISKHYERCELLYSESSEWFINPTYVDISETYRQVESSGIGITQEILTEYEIKNPKFSINKGRAYTSYNLYNHTGRPTNSFNGINFLAIPKIERVRNCFVAKNNYLVEFDFDAYHPRIIAKELGVELPNTQLHEYFAKLYFGKEEVTQEDYKKSKEITFRQMYGGVAEEYKDITFFSKMSEKIESLYKSYLENKYLILPTGIKLPYTRGLGKLKVFNYWVQSLETLNNYFFISKILDKLHNKRTKLVLITYDSYLLDFSVEDGKELLQGIKKILEENGMYVKHRYGITYNL